MSTTVLSRNTDSSGSYNGEGTLKRDVYNAIFHLGEPSECPFISLLGGEDYSKDPEKATKIEGKVKREVADAIKYEVIEKDPLGRQLTLSSVGGGGNVELTFADASGVRVGNTLYCQNTGERALVISKASNVVTVRRNLGSTSYTATAADIWTVMGYAARQGGSKASILSQIAEPRVRYTQIFKWTFGVSNTLKKVLLETNGSVWDEEMTQASVEHKRDLEFSFWLNPAADSSTDTNSYTVYMTRGLLAELGSTHTIDCEGSLDEDKLFGDVAEQIFQYGSRRKTLFCDAKAKTKINSFARVKQQTKAKDTAYGLSVQEIETGHGVLEMVSFGLPDRFFPENSATAGVYTKGFMCALDLENIKYKHIKDRDSYYETKVQTPGDDAEEGQFITEAGVLVSMLAHHKIINNIGA
jgi:hypothetical protein